MLNDIWIKLLAAWKLRKVSRRDKLVVIKVDNKAELVYRKDIPLLLKKYGKKLEVIC